MSIAGEALQKVGAAEAKARNIAGFLPPGGGPDFDQKIRETPGLIIRSGKMKGERLLVESLPFRIGRGPNNHLQLPEAQVGPYHAVITRDAEGQYLLSSAVEGSCPLYIRKGGRFKVQTIIPLRDKMTVQIGPGGTRL